MPFNETFGGSILFPADLSYLALAISENVELLWPLEQQVGGSLVVADIIDLTASAPGLNVDMPDATLVSQGTSVLFNNVGAQTVTIRDQAGATIISLASGTAWVIYLRDNTTEAGLWRTFQFGASVSVANAAALAGAGLKAISTTLNTRIAVSPKAANYNILNSDRAVALVWTSGVGTFNLPTAGTVGADWYCIVRNSGNGDLSVIPPSGTIDGAASATFPAGSSAFVVCDGLNYFTIGFGNGASGGGGGGFDFVTINVPGSGNYVLAGAELNRVGYRFTGVLTGNRNIVVPNSTDEYWVDNQTTGAFSLFVKTAAQVTGVEVLQNSRNILYCDGTNVIPAESSSISFPIPVAQGGTGAITAATARTNLGAASLGDVQANPNVFTSRQTVSNTDPSWDLNETDGAANNRLWSISAVGETFKISAWDDARATFVDIFTVDRTLNVIDGIFFRGPVTTPNVSASEVGYKGIPQNIQNPPYTAVLTDANKHLYTAVGGSTWTIPSNAAVPYPVGTALTFVNRSAANSISILITTDTLVMAGTGFTGTRALAPNSMATALKIASTVWMISGAGLA